ncbi:hypothetical protein BN1723_018276, partial [Verticillium longisporum]
MLIMRAPLGHSLQTAHPPRKPITQLAPLGPLQHGRQQPAKRLPAVVLGRDDDAVLAHNLDELLHPLGVKHDVRHALEPPRDAIPPAPVAVALKRLERRDDLARP